MTTVLVPLENCRTPEVTPNHVLVRSAAGAAHATVASIHFTQNLTRHTTCPSATFAGATGAELLER